MFYETEKNDHGLPRPPFKSVAVPRPIGWISTLDENGKANLAPYSQFTNLTSRTSPTARLTGRGISAA